MMKSPQTSKINWIALVMLILSFLQDPKFLDLIPQEVGLWIFRIAALLIIIIRTIYTQVVCAPPDLVHDPNVAAMDTDVVVQEALHRISGKIEP